MTDSPDLIVSGGGSMSVSTDALRSESEKLRALSIALPMVSLSLGGVARIAGPAEARALGSWRAREADAAITAARSRLDSAIGECERIADALDAAALAYGEAERDAAARFISIAEDLAARSGAFVGDVVHRNRGLAALLALLATSMTRDRLWRAIGPNDIELSDDLNALFSDPEVVRMLRSLLMAGDDFVEGVVHVSDSGSTSEVGAAALVLLSLGAMGGLFASAPVTTTAFGASRPTRPATTVAERARRIPNAVAGDVPQVRIEKYSEPGLPDRFEVYIGGTVDFSPVAKGEPFDLTSNLELEAGLPAGAYQGVQQAMEQAGITADSPIVLTGHSQGGLVASRLAGSGDYHVEALVTFGAPAGQVAIPASVPSLIVENTDDVVPALGGTQANTDALVVRARAYPEGQALPPGLALPAHRIEAYLATAEAIDERAQSGDVVAFRERLAGLTAGYGHAEAQQYLVTRAR